MCCQCAKKSAHQANVVVIGGGGARSDRFIAVGLDLAERDAERGRKPKSHYSFPNGALFMLFCALMQNASFFLLIGKWVRIFWWQFGNGNFAGGKIFINLLFRIHRIVRHHALLKENSSSGGCSGRDFLFGWGKRRENLKRNLKRMKIGKYL